MDKKVLTIIRKACGKVREATNLVMEAGEAINDDFKLKEVTLPELARLVAGRTGIKRSCALEVLETAFEITAERGLIFDLGTEVYDDEE